jgi:hypothetical protein
MAADPPPPPTRVGTLNVNGIAAACMETKLTSIVHLMEQLNILILAVQETKIPNTTDLDEFLPQLHYSFHGEPGTDSRSHRHTGGVGFIVHSQLSHHFIFVGKRHQHKYASAWATLKHQNSAENVHLASVYLPDSSRSTVEYSAALTLLAQDVLHFQSKPGSILLLGDFNARVGHARLPDCPNTDVAPPLGEPHINSNGIRLLQLCADAGLTFVTGHNPDTSIPTFSRRRGIGAATSIIDHILTHTCALKQPRSRPPTSPCTCATQTTA